MAQNRRELTERAATSSARRVPPPLRFGAAWVYVVIHHKPAGRDVGLAKSGFRPTAPLLAPSSFIRLIDRINQLTHPAEISPVRTAGQSMQMQDVRLILFRFQCAGDR